LAHHGRHTKNGIYNGTAAQEGNQDKQKISGRKNQGLRRQAKLLEESLQDVYSKIGNLAGRNHV
jgi:hypothetical protein